MSIQDVATIEVLCRVMDGIVDLGESSHCPSTQMPIDVDCDIGSEFVDNQTPASSAPATTRGGRCTRGRSNTARASSAPSQPLAALLYNFRGPNWTEAEMLVFIGQKHIEWDGRHNSNQPSLAKFVYGTTAWT